MSPKVIAMCLAAALVSASVSAGVTYHTHLLNKETKTIQMDLVDEDSGQVLESYVFRPTVDGDYVLDSMVSPYPEDEDGEEVEDTSHDSASPNDILNSDSTFDGVNTVNSKAVAGGIAVDSIPLNLEEEKGVVYEGWEKVKRGLTAAQERLEMLYESLKAKVPDVHQDDSISGDIERTAEDAPLVAGEPDTSIPETTLPESPQVKQ